MSEIFAAVGICIAFLVGATSLILVPVFIADRAACSSKSELMGVQHSWGPLQECMVQVDGRWMPLASYKVVRFAK